MNFVCFPVTSLYVKEVNPVDVRFGPIQRLKYIFKRPYTELGLRVPHNYDAAHS